MRKKISFKEEEKIEIVETPSLIFSSATLIFSSTLLIRFIDQKGNKKHFKTKNKFTLFRKIVFCFFFGLIF